MVLRVCVCVCAHLRLLSVSGAVCGGSDGGTLDAQTSRQSSDTYFTDLTHLHLCAGQ